MSTWITTPAAPSVGALHSFMERRRPIFCWPQVWPTETCDNCCSSRMVRTERLQVLCVMNGAAIPHQDPATTCRKNRGSGWLEVANDRTLREAGRSIVVKIVAVDIRQNAGVRSPINR